MMKSRVPLQKPEEAPTKTGEILRPGMRVRLHGFDGAYEPSQPTGTVHGWNGDWFGVIFDPHVRFTREDKDHGWIPPRPYYGFTAACFSVMDDLPAEVGSQASLKIWLDTGG